MNKWIPFPKQIQDMKTKIENFIIIRYFLKNFRNGRCTNLLHLKAIYVRI